MKIPLNPPFPKGEVDWIFQWIIWDKWNKGVVRRQFSGTALNRGKPVKMESNVPVKFWKRRMKMKRISKGIYTQEI